MSYGVLLRGLPYDCSTEDILQFFNAISLHKNSVEMIHMFNGRFSGIAHVKLRSRDEVKLALLMDQNHMGDRYIDVMEIMEDKLEQIRDASITGIGRIELHRMCNSDTPGNSRPSLPPPRGSERGGRRGGRGGGYQQGRGGGGGQARDRSRSPPSFKTVRTRFAYVTGFPPDTLYKGVRQFFEGCLIGKSCVHLFRAENDRFRGDGYIEFGNSDELKKALKRNGDMYQGIYRITIEPCSETEVSDMKPYMMDATRPGSGGRRASGHFEEPSYGGYRHSSKEGDYGGYRDYHGNGRARESRYPVEEYHHERWAREYRHDDHFASVEPLGRRSHFRGGGGERMREARREIEPDRFSYVSGSRAGGGGGAGGGAHYSSGGGGGGHGSSMPLPSNSRDKKTLKVDGLSPSATITDIVTFFRNYGIEYECVRMQCYDDGTPNGKAFVTFPSERIASAALHDMNRRLLKSSYVDLSLVHAN